MKSFQYPACESNVKIFRRDIFILEQFLTFIHNKTVFISRILNINFVGFANEITTKKS